MSTDEKPGGKIAAFWNRNERRISSVALIVGFIIDSFTIANLPLPVVNGAFLSYILFIGFCIVALNALEARASASKFLARLHALTLIAMQFTIGATMSGFLVFYSQSATLGGSWPFLLFFLTLLVGNEFLREKYLRLGFQISVFFIALSSYLIFLVPFLLGRIGVGTFLVSEAAGIIVVVLFLRLLSLVSRQRVLEGTPIIVGSVFGITLLLNLFYFTNIIPPIPLSLREAGVYILVERSPDGSYLLWGEEKRWYEKLRLRDRVRVSTDEATLYFWSAVFAPTRLTTDVVHVWERFDEAVGRWEVAHRAPFSIVGGRDGGYRAYSAKTVSPGRWRVGVETPRGQRIGRTSFVVEEVETPPRTTLTVR